MRPASDFIYIQLSNSRDAVHYAFNYALNFWQFLNFKI